jgi:4'-phosphopantetheinyl transferase
MEMNTSCDFFFSHQTLGDLPGDLDWLHPGELSFLETLRFENRRNDWLLGRWTAKRALLSFLENEGLALEMKDILIQKKASGAPVAAFDIPVQPCSLSLSHRAGHAIAVAAPGDVPIGCDLELIEPRSEAFITDYFSDRERELIRKDPPFFSNLLWCVKESVMKATGEGMRIHPARIEVEVDKDVSASLDDGGMAFKGFWKKEDGFVWVVLGVKN